MHGMSSPGQCAHVHTAAYGMTRCGVPAAVQQLPPQISMATAREEAEMVLFDSVKSVLEATGLKPGQVHICVTLSMQLQHAEQCWCAMQAC